MRFVKEHIAPCGINCGTCYAFLRRKNKCAGCLADSEQIMGYCLRCRIRLCEERNSSEFTYCFECPQYPCIKIKKIDKRYTKSYRLSLMDNLNSIQRSGIEDFLTHENEKWKCGNCGEILCVHKKACPHCGHEYR